MTTKIVYAEAARTAAPDASASVDLESAGASEVRAVLRVTTASTGTATQRLTVQAQHSNDGSTWENNPGIVAVVPGSTGGTDVVGLPAPLLVEMAWKPRRRYHRWNVTHVTGTPSMTWGLEEVYSTAGGPARLVTPNPVWTATTVVNAVLILTLGAIFVEGFQAWSITTINSGANPFTANTIQGSNVNAYPGIASGSTDWANIDVSLAVLAAGATGTYREGNNGWRWMRVLNNSGAATTAVHNFQGIPRQ